MNRESSFEPIIAYIEKQYDRFLDAEQGPNYRSKQFDSRVHCLLYFLPSSFTKLKVLDIEFLQRLSTKVNVVPVISKADSMSPEEILQYKKLILKEFEKCDIKSYPTFHTSEHDAIKELEKHIPFAVVGSDKLVSVDGKKVRARQYKWGTVQGIVI
jgi:septin family protein